MTAETDPVGDHQPVFKAARAIFFRSGQSVDASANLDAVVPISAVGNLCVEALNARADILGLAA